MEMPETTLASGRNFSSAAYEFLWTGHGTAARSDRNGHTASRITSCLTTRNAGEGRPHRAALQKLQGLARLIKCYPYPSRLRKDTARCHQQRPHRSDQPDNTQMESAALELNNSRHQQAAQYLLRSKSHKTNHSGTTHQMAPLVTASIDTPTIKEIPTPLSYQLTNTQTDCLNLITQTLQQTINALTTLVQHISLLTSPQTVTAQPTPGPLQITSKSPLTKSQILAQINNLQPLRWKVKAFQNKIWEDELRALDPDDGSLWEMSKELRKKSQYALNGQGGIAHTDSDKAEKAFDRVWHTSLLYKLIKINAPPQLILIIKSFLNNRSFAVRVNDTHSSTKQIRAGAPQGAPLPHLIQHLHQRHSKNTTNDSLLLRRRYCDPHTEHEQKLHHSLPPQTPGRARGLVQKNGKFPLIQKKLKQSSSLSTSTRKPPPIHVQNHPVPWSRSVNYLVSRWTSTSLF
ncbi:hypothetical protein TNCV_929761 [Trichonephila clavipes]|nr:hypothetical protein TNCV_929761 [Trichonephila clavipes]